MEKITKIKELSTIYLPGVLVISAVTGFLFFLFPAILFITLFINIVLLYIHQYLIFYMVLYMILYGFMYYGVMMFIVTLKNNADKEQIDYDIIQHKLSTIIAFIMLAIFAIIYLLIF